MRYEILVKGSPIDSVDRDGDAMDDCWTGEDFDSLFEALCCFNALLTYKTPAGWHEQAAMTSPGTYVILIDHHLAVVEEYRMPGRAERDSEAYGSIDDWRREQAMEAGMLHGVDAYNDEMGY